MVSAIIINCKYLCRLCDMFSSSDMPTNLVCVCVSDIGALYKNKRNLLTSDNLEMCTILLEQFNSVLLHHSQTRR